MKTIVLMPVKNEAWILESALQNISQYADSIIISDQMSTDGSRDIYKRFPKVTVIDNTRSGHSNEVRWELLHEARKIVGNNLILCIDADEMIPPEKVVELQKSASLANIGTVFSLPWIQLWKDGWHYRTDGVWKDNYKHCAFVDDRKAEYEKVVVQNDHTSRVPTLLSGEVVTKVDIPLLHFQFLAMRRMEIKQAWYRCNELIAAPENARRINHKYAVTSNITVKLTQTPEDWLKEFPNLSVFGAGDEIRLQQIEAWFDQFGISFFEPVEIWNIPSFRERFVKEKGREPHPITYPKFLVFLNDIKKRLLQ